MREKIKVPEKAYQELMALNREIHFTSNFAEIIKKADDRGYSAAVDWLRTHEEEFKIGFAWGFEPIPEPKQVSRNDSDLSPPPKRAPPAPKPAAPPKKPSGFFGKISRIFRK